MKIIFTKWLAVNNKVKIDSKEIVKPEMTNNFTLSGLIKFFKDPVKYFYNNYFGISLDEPEEILADSEPFEIDHLQKYNLNQELICLLFNKQDAINFRNLNKASGVLPYNLFGSYLLNDLEKDINGIIPKLNNLAVDLTVNSKMLINLSAEFTIEAEVTGLHQDNLVFIYPSNKLKGKHIISSWLSHLCCCYGNSTTTHIVAIEEYKLLKPISQEQAIEHLNDLCMIYQQGLNRPLPWLADIGFNWLKKITSNKQELDFNYQDLIEDYINNNMNRRSSYYLNLVYPDVASYCEEFNLLAEKIMQPINSYLTKNV